ncbi:VOC family protein [Micromonospora sp. NPDC049460]|uniref:VOC family protein n=1 Tax=unclassified Micromonospora TaxID=2617518 RepID=UPI0037165CB4
MIDDVHDPGDDPRGRAMEQRISLVTLGVADVARARAFYERLGWRGQEVEETVFFQAGGLALVLWSRDKLAADAGVADGRGFGGMTLAQNVRSRGEVDELLAVAADAGAEVTRPARETFYGGYAGCFADPDGHVWEIACNPGFPLADDGSLTVPDFGRGADDVEAGSGPE